MTGADQIAAALQHIASHGGDLDLETDLALKALAADYERLKAENAELKQALTSDGSVRAEMYRNVYQKQAEEIAQLQPLKVEDLQAEIERLKAGHCECCDYADAISYPRKVAKDDQQPAEAVATIERLTAERSRDV